MTWVITTGALISRQPHRLIFAPSSRRTSGGRPSAKPNRSTRDPRSARGGRRWCHGFGSWAPAECCAVACGPLSGPIGHSAESRAAQTCMNAEWPREESNLRAQIRSLSLYPLSYGASRAVCPPLAMPLARLRARRERERRRRGRPSRRTPCPRGASARSAPPRPREAGGTGARRSWRHMRCTRG